tara:strand:+ start:766 stop:1023 length:258 start_codon:yes stop_codon:yes gene_type:complete
MIKIFKGLIVLITLIYPSHCIIGQSKAKIRTLDKMIVQGIKDWQIPGLTAVVVNDQKVVFKKTYGVKNIENKEPVDEFTLYGVNN